MDGARGNRGVWCPVLDILITPSTPMVGRNMLRALAKTAGVPTCEAPRRGSTLMLYGFGGPDRYQLGLNHIANGGRLVAWDLGYWDRKGTQRKLRMSVDGLHCPSYIMRGPVPSAIRWKESGLNFAQHGDPHGPIILVGNGPKSNVIGAEGWASAKSREIAQVFPGRRVLYRPKPKRPVEANVKCHGIAEGPIDEVLRSASLVVCRHSNVAVDACRLGIPVVCEDGAAAAIYPRALAEHANQPSRARRHEFLIRLAWWQWSEHEAADGLVWPWLNQVLQ